MVHAARIQLPILLHQGDTKPDTIFGVFWDLELLGIIVDATNETRRVVPCSITVECSNIQAVCQVALCNNP